MSSKPKLLISQYSGKIFNGTLYILLMDNKAPSQIFGISKRKSLLCVIGLPKWKKRGGLNISSSNVREIFFMQSMWKKEKRL
jgi:hypothetical protein